jgi:uncharacterized protein YsxB (DUF464 family)
MIKYVRYIDEDGNDTGFEASGHAGFASLGQDIVCSAVTSAINFCVRHLDTIEAKYEIEFSDDNKITLTLNGKVGTHALKTLASLIKDYRSTYKDNIEISVRRW